MNALAVNAVFNDPVAKPAASGSTAPWAQRVRWIGGLIQGAFAAFWLVRGSVVIGGAAGHALLAIFGLLVCGVFSYAIGAAAGTAPRPSATRRDKRIELQITIATVIEFAAAIVLPIVVRATGHSDWTLPSIAITIGPLLLWLDYRVSIPRYRAVGWALTVGPLALVATMSGTLLVATTGLTAGTLLLGTALAGFHDLAATKRTTQHAGTGNVTASVGAPR
jgi:hypothetical protein